jgi:hypothetical protein
MPALRFDSWAFWPQSVFSGLAILLAAAVLSLALFPLAHGSFVSTHGPATALRSRRLFQQIYLWLATLAAILAGVFCSARACLNSCVATRHHELSRQSSRASLTSAVLLC